MEVMPIDITAVIAVTGGILMVLVPILGITARFAIKPIAEAMAKVRETQGSNEQLNILQQRVELMEQQMANMETEVHRLREAQEFQRQLDAGE